MMWQVNGTAVDPKQFGTFEPQRVLNYYDGPRIFTFLDADQELHLAVFSDEDETHCRFLAVPTTDATIARLESGELSVHDAVSQPPLWVIDMTASRDNGSVERAWSIVLEDVPNDARPRFGINLHRTQPTLADMAD